VDFETWAGTLAWRGIQASHGPATGRLPRPAQEEGRHQAADYRPPTSIPIAGPKAKTRD